MTDLYAFDDGHGVDPTQHIYISVEFTEGGKTYYYRTYDESIDVGDWVVVPVRDADEKIVKVVKVEEFREDEVPMDLIETKFIIRKYEVDTQ